MLSDVAVFRAGLEEPLRLAGFRPERPSDLNHWARSYSATRERCAAVVSIRGPRDLEQIRRLAGLRVIVSAALVDPTPLAFVRAIECGAATAIDYASEPAQYVASVLAAFEGQTILPTVVAADLARLAMSGLTSDIPDDFGWLRDLASGATVSTLATTYGYSERAMYRNLRSLYERIGATGRAQAIERAVHLGLI